MISRRVFGLSLASLALSGCGDDIINRIGRTGRIALGNSEFAYNPEDARKLPYALMDVKLGISPHSLVVLSTRSGDTLNWLTSDKLTITTRRGRVIQTSQFVNDLISTQFWKTDPILDGSPAQGSSVRVVDLEYRSLFGLTIDSQWTSHGPEVVDLVGQERSLEKVTEYCTCRNLDWEFENIFWRDNSSFVWKSEQHYMLNTPPFEMTVLIPPQS